MVNDAAALRDGGNAERAAIRFASAANIERNALMTLGIEIERRERPVETGDVRAASAVLRGIGALRGQPDAIGEEDPTILREETEMAQREAASRRALRSLMAF